MNIAHKRESDNAEQSIIDHLKGTAERSAKFGSSFNNSEFAYMCGLLHDIGKYSEEFQNRIRNNGKKCDHSSAGARLINKSSVFGKLAAYCIAGHHSGLLNCGNITDVGGEGTLYGRLSPGYIVPRFDKYAEDLNIDESISSIKPNLKPLNTGGFSVSFLVRMLYSALVDADFLDTEQFMRNNQIDRNIEYNINLLYEKLSKKLNSFSSDSLINIKRKEILDSCIKMSDCKPGLFTLTVPTGGGKTLSSMAFAINHLIKNKMDRIIYIIPYTSIIEQNARVFKDVFGENVVLEHHSNFDFNADENDYDKLRLSSENWDVPIVITTNVQFFESLFANKSSRCRKLHNIANSVLIFDEAQMFPQEYLKPCIMAIAELVYNCNSTAVLCSATQPSLTDKFPHQIKSTEICANNKELYLAFKRTKVINRGLITSETLQNELMNLNQCLCIVNTRKHALNLYKSLYGEGNYHLSTLMCPEHRKNILNKIRERLKLNLPCRVVSTRLIEAGVDVDFPKVYRMICGLDSIVQAAGRCNREGKLKLGEVHVFEPEEEYTKRQPPSFKRETEIAKIVMSMHDDPSSLEAINHYFNQLYYHLGDDGIDTKGIYKRLEQGFANGKFEYDFEDIAGEFKIIAENTLPIIIPYNNEAVELINELESSEYIGKILRKLQSYTVNIYEGEYNNLLASGKLMKIKDGIMKIRSMEFYDDMTGLKIEESSGSGIFI